MIIAKYKTSKDYARLYDLAKEHRIICITDYMNCRDVCKSIYHPAGRFQEVVELSARGISYIYAHTKEEFIQQCTKDNVEFIEPESEVTK